MPRVWVYEQMKNDTTLQAAMGDRIYPSTKIVKAPAVKPFILYRQTSDVDAFRGDDSDAIRSAGYMIFCHADAGTYMGIDTYIAALQGLFKDTVDQANGITRCRWAETSDDLRDDDLGTIFKFARIQVYYRV